MIWLHIRIQREVLLQTFWKYDEMTIMCFSWGKLAWFWWSFEKAFRPPLIEALPASTAPWMVSGITQMVATADQGKGCWKGGKGLPWILSSGFSFSVPYHMTPKSSNLERQHSRLQFPQDVPLSLQCWWHPQWRGSRPNSATGFPPRLPPAEPEWASNKLTDTPGSPNHLMNTPDTIPWGPAAQANQVPNQFISLTKR